MKAQVNTKFESLSKSFEIHRFSPEVTEYKEYPVFDCAEQSFRTHADSTLEANTPLFDTEIKRMPKWSHLVGDIKKDKYIIKSRVRHCGSSIKATASGHFSCVIADGDFAFVHNDDHVHRQPLKFDGYVMAKHHTTQYLKKHRAYKNQTTMMALFLPSQ